MHTILLQKYCIYLIVIGFYLYLFEEKNLPKTILNMNQNDALFFFQYFFIQSFFCK